MVEAQEIYRRFCATPLRLRAKPSQSPSSSPSPESDGSPAAPFRPELAEQPPIGQSFPVDQQRETETEVEKLEARIEVECRVEDAPAHPTPLQMELSTGAVPSRRASARTTTRPEKVPEPISRPAPPSDVVAKDVAAPTKQKRVTRAVAMLNSNTGGMCVDTPTKAAAPPKRSRKSGSCQPAKAKAVTVAVATAGEPALDDGDICMDDAEKENVSITRNIMDGFAEIDDALADPVVVDKPATRKAQNRRKSAPRQPKPRKAPSRSASRRKQTQEPTRRSSRLRGKADKASSLTDDVDGDDQAIGDCEEIVQDMLPVEKADLVKPPPAIDVEKAFCQPLLLTKTTSGAFFALWFSALRCEVEECKAEDVGAVIEILGAFFSICLGISQCEVVARSQDADDSDDDEQGKDARKTKRKTVRFRHFDLSTLNLRYIDDKKSGDLVEDLVRRYVDIVDHVSILWDRRHHPAQADIIAHVVGVLRNTDRLATQSGGMGIVTTTFFAMCEFEHDDIRASQLFFSQEFAKLVTPGTSSFQFLDVMFSPLVSSLARFRLRELFLPFDPRGLLDDGERLAIAKYEHQDFGAAIHRALRELHQFHGLVAPVLAVILNTSGDEEATRKAVVGVDVDELVHMERYLLAARYLRLSFGKCILLDYEGDEEATQMRERLEQLCALAQRLRFDDEVHLFPLASIERFVKALEGYEPSLAVLENALHAVGLPHYDAEAPCVECNEIVTHDQQAEAISCISCSGRFHLKCLDLPLSFAQFAGSYTCPFCYVGRTR